MSNNKKYVYRATISRELLKQLFSKGWDKTAVIANSLPEDAFMIHSKFNITSGTFDMYFLSDIAGYPFLEGEDIINIESKSPTFQRIDTIDKTKAKDSFKKLFDKWDTPEQTLTHEDFQEFEREMGL